MALLYDAQLDPGKLEAISAWLPGQPWSGVATGAEVERVSSYRFDDPADEVGIEVHLVRVPGTEAVIQVPVTYRGAPLAGAEAHLVTEMDHSVLGDRWVYEGTADPVLLAEFERAIRTGGTNAREFIRTDDGDIERFEIAAVTGEPVPEAGAGADAEASRSGATGSGATGSSAERPPSPTTLEGTTTVPLGAADLEILRFPLPVDAAPTDRPVLGRLIGTWEGQDTPQLLARLVAH